MKKIIALFLFAVITLNSALLHAGETIAHDDQGNDIGFIRYGQCKIFELYVTSDMRKKGVGSMLFHKAIEEMGHCQKIQWYSSSFAINFYLKQGAMIENSNLMSITPEQSRANRKSKPKYVVPTKE